MGRDAPPRNAQQTLRTIGEFADAVVTFLREEVPKRFGEFASTITDNFRVIDPKDFQIVA
jgi:hypothetical protein